MRKCTICHKPLDQCHHVPSKQYDIFIKAFEKFVHERQEEVKLVDRLMRPYEVVREAIERCRFPNEVDLSIKLKTDGIKVKVNVKKDQPPKLFAPLIQYVGEALVSVKLHADGEPARSKSNFYRNYIWKLVVMDKQNPPTIDVELHLPFGSGKHITMTSKEVLEPAYLRTEYHVDWHDEPRVTPNAEDTKEVPF